MSKHRRLCLQENENLEVEKIEHNDTENLYDARQDQDHDYGMNQDIPNEHEVRVGNEASHAEENENGMIEDEPDGTNEEVGHTVHDQRHLYLAITCKEAEVINFCGWSKRVMV